MPNLGTNFYPKLVEISSELGMKPEDLLAVMVSESGINPGAHEQKYNGGGLLGFMPQTLHNLNFKGSPEDFRKLTGEAQLEWVKKLVQSYMGFNGGKPFKSATQYYIANFVPAALGLPGIRREDDSYAFLEENPESIRDPRTGQAFSKKYYDIGVKLPVSQERLFYKTNPLFHGGTKGAITYGDMAKQVNKNKQSATYRQALANMKGATGYQPNDMPVKQKTPEHSSSFSDFFAKLTKLVQQFSFASNNQNDFLITVGSSSDYSTTLEYARVLSAAIEDYFDAKTNICSNSNDVEIECKVAGDKKVMFNAIRELSFGISDAFKHATSDIGSVNTFALITLGNKSEFETLHPKVADLHCRKFKLKFARTK